jgi:hypothetical protein
MSFILIPNKGEDVQVMLGIGVQQLNSYASETLSRPNMLNFLGATDVALALTLTWQTQWLRR